MTDPVSHYPTRAAKCADLAVHLAGLAFAVVGGVVLLSLSAQRGSLGQVAAVAIYAGGLVVMLALSTAYNFARPAWRPWLRRIDQVGIFLMIAGSYTPFTTQKLHGPWGVGMTVAVWTVALAGVTAKLFLPRLERRVGVGLYLVMGWLVLAAVKPMLEGLSWTALVLLALGGLTYSTGAVIYMARRLKFRRAIWHGHVVGGAALQYAAVLVGVVLAQPR